VVDNFNEASRAATGRYLSFIGDDDFVSSEIVNVARWALTQRVDALKFNFPALYYWPDFRQRTQGDALAASLRIGAFDGSIVKHDAKKALFEALNNFGGGVMEMPRAYAGMVSADLVKTIQQKHGLLFGGVSPDIYSATLISLEAQNCVKISFPVIVPGASGASTSGQSAHGRHVGSLRDNEHIGAFRDLEWDVRIPEFYSVPTVWSYSLLKAVEAAKLPGSKVNFARLYAKCLLYQRTHHRHTLRTLKSIAPAHGWTSLLIGVLSGFLHEAFWITRKVWERVWIKFKPVSAGHVQTQLPNTAVASAAFEKYMAEQCLTVQYPSTLSM
jgi:hypothetical protein